MDPGVDWGIFASMETRPGGTAVRLMDGWKKQDRDIALGRTILNGEETVGYLVFAINSSRFQPALDQADTQILIADRFGRIFLSNTYNFTDKSNQVIEALEGAGRYLHYDKNLYLAGCQEVYHGMFRVYSVSDIQNIVVSLGMGGRSHYHGAGADDHLGVLQHQAGDGAQDKGLLPDTGRKESARDGDLERIHIDSRQ